MLTTNFYSMDDFSIYFARNNCISVKQLSKRYSAITTPLRIQGGYYTIQIDTVKLHRVTCPPPPPTITYQKAAESTKKMRKKTKARLIPTKRPFLAPSSLASFSLVS